MAASLTREQELEAALNSVFDWLVHASIATPDDMAQSFPKMTRVVGDALSVPEKSTEIPQKEITMFTEPMKAAARAALREEVPALSDSGVCTVTDAILAAAEAAMVPEYLYDPVDWEYTTCWEDRDMLVDEGLNLGEMQEFHTLIHSPSMWAVHVVLTRDDDGDADETEVQWFLNRWEAEMALGNIPGT